MKPCATTGRMILAASPLIISFLSLVQAAVVTLPLDRLFSDESTAPAYVGTDPWLKVTTTDTGSNQVSLELEATALTGDEHVALWYLNLDPSLDLTQVSFTVALTSGDFLLPSIEKSTNAYRADADGLYDIRMTFSTSNHEGGIERFTDGDKLTYTVSYTGSGTLDSSSFEFLSLADGETTYGPFFSAAHVESTGAGGLDSAWISAIPEPSVAMCSLLGTGILLGVGRRRRNA